MNYNPMLAVTVTEENLDKLVYPVLVQPKYDGIRCIITQSGPKTRTGKPIPNKKLAEKLSSLNPGLDCELLVGDHDANVFNRTQSVVMSHEHELTGLVYVVAFDTISDSAAGHRLSARVPSSSSIVVIPAPSLMCSSAEEVVEESKRLVALGFEGAMLRAESAPYKHGRSTLKDQCLLKLKPRDDSEAVVTGGNPLVDKNGNTQNKLGSLVCKWGDTSFELGTGFNNDQRVALWRDLPLGKLVTFYYQGVGTRGRPRFPAFKAFREDL